MASAKPNSGIEQPVTCPECGRFMLYRQVCKVGNILTGEPMHFEALYQCEYHPVMMTVPCSQAWAREQWSNQNADSERAASESEE